jgi:NDP-sugar pyrophosphorylase family protein
MLNIVIPVGGKARRFYDAGYTEYKPFLSIGEKTMIERVRDNLKTDNCRFIFSVRPQDEEKFRRLFPTEIVVVDTVQDGAAMGVLITKNLIQNEPLIIANSDQFVDIDINDFIDTDLDARIMTFYSDHPKWSYAKTCDGLVTEVAEKKVISEHATVGIYYFKNGSDFVLACGRMIEDNFRVNGEFYTCPAYNFMPRHKKIGIYEIEKERMYGLGTPEDFEANAEKVRAISN